MAFLGDVFVTQHYVQKQILGSKEQNLTNRNLHVGSLVSAKGILMEQRLNHEDAFLLLLISLFKVFCTFFLIHILFVLLGCFNFFVYIFFWETLCWFSARRLCTSCTLVTFLLRGIAVTFVDGIGATHHSFVKPHQGTKR